MLMAEGHGVGSVATWVQSSASRFVVFVLVGAMLLAALAGAYLFCRRRAHPCLPRLAKKDKKDKPEAVAIRTMLSPRTRKGGLPKPQPILLHPLVAARLSHDSSQEMVTPESQPRAKTLVTAL